MWGRQRQTVLLWKGSWWGQWCSPVEPKESESPLQCNFLSLPLRLQQNFVKCCNLVYNLVSVLGGNLGWDFSESRNHSWKCNTRTKEQVDQKCDSHLMFNKNWGFFAGLGTWKYPSGIFGAPWGKNMKKGEAFFQLHHLGSQTIISKTLREKFDFWKSV